MRASYGGLKGADLTAMNNRVRYRRGGVAAVMVADTMVGWGRAPTLKLEKPAASVDLQIHVVAADGEKWAEQANGAVDANRKVKLPQAIQQHQKKWREFWQNQSIFIGGTRGSKTVPAALVHTQWLSKCSGRGSYAFKPKPAAKDGARKGVARWPAAKIKQKMAEVLDEAAAGLGTGSRFAGTWGPYFANLPKAGAVQSLFDAVRDMVVEEHGGKIYLFPGWPGGRDVSFRLALSGNRRIEAVYAKGKFDEIEVWPKRQTGSVVGLGKFAKTTRRALAGRFRMPALISFISPSHGASGGMEPLAVTMKDAGFNGYEGNVSNLEWCKKHGFYLLMHGVNEWTAARLKDDKTVISYYMSDRRKTNWFPIFGNIRKHYEAIDPNHPTEFTMYVRYGGFEYFVDAVRPHLLEYYDYHWTRGHHLQAAYLEIYRARSIEAGGIPIFRYCHVHGDPPTKMRQTVTMSLAYGVKGFKWWVGWCMFDIHNIKKGVPPPLSPIGQEAKNIGASLKAFSPYLATAQSLQVYNTKPQPGGTRAAPKDYWVVPSGDHVVMGVFRNDDYEKYRYLVVGNRDIGSARTVTLTFQTKMLKIAKMNKKTRKWVKVPIKKTAKGQTVRVKLEHGGVELICVEPVKKWDE